MSAFLAKGYDGVVEARSPGSPPRRRIRRKHTDAVRAIPLAVRELRVELGEPSDRTAVTVEDVIKREYARWMVPAEEEEGPPEV